MRAGVGAVWLSSGWVQTGRFLGGSQPLCDLRGCTSAGLLQSC